MKPEQRRHWLIVGAIILVTVIVGILGFTRGYCWYYGWVTSYETKYVPMVGCVAKGSDNKWLPLERFRDVN